MCFIFRSYGFHILCTVPAHGLGRIFSYVLHTLHVVIIPGEWILIFCSGGGFKVSERSLGGGRFMHMHIKISGVGCSGGGDLGVGVARGAALL